MTTDELAEAIRDHLRARRSLRDAHDLLAAFARAGGTRDDAQVVIEQLRTAPIEEAAEDALLDLVDIVTGQISANLRVWP